MSHYIVAQGGYVDLEQNFYEYDGGQLKDDDRYGTTGQLPVTTVITPASGVNPPTTGAATRLSTGAYKVRLTALSNTTLTSALATGQKWYVRWTIQINNQSRSFDQEFTVKAAGASSEQPTFYNATNDFRIGLAQVIETLDRKARVINDTDTLREDGVKIVEVLKNGTALVEGTAYTFYRPATIKWLQTTLDTDVITVRYANHFEDHEIEKTAKYVKSQIDAGLSTVYTLPFAQSPEIVKGIEWMWVRGELLLTYGPRPGTIAGKDDALTAKSWIAAAQAKLAELVSGDLPVILPDGTTVAVKNEPDDLFVSIVDGTAE